MKLALMAYSFISSLQTSAVTTADVIRFTHDVDVGAVELMDEFARTDDQRAAIQAALAETGLAIACYDIVCPFATADPERRVAAVAAVEAACGRAADLGASHVLLIPGAPEPDLPVATVRQQVAAGSGPACQRRGGSA